LAHLLFLLKDPFDYAQDVTKVQASSMRNSL